MIPMKWKEDSENSENSALDTIIVSHKIYEKKIFFIGFTLLRRIHQLNNILINIGVGVVSLVSKISSESTIIHENYFTLNYFL
jgi:hypothetical protein